MAAQQGDNDVLDTDRPAVKHGDSGFSGVFLSGQNNEAAKNSLQQARAVFSFTSRAKTYVLNKNFRAFGTWS